MPRTGRRLPPAIKAQVKDLILQKVPYERIQEITGVPLSTISRTAKALWAEIQEAQARQGAYARPEDFRRLIGQLLWANFEAQLAQMEVLKDPAYLHALDIEGHERLHTLLTTRSDLLMEAVEEDHEEIDQLLTTRAVEAISRPAD